MRQTIRRAALLVAAAVLGGAVAGAANAWDSIKQNPTHPTHTYLTEYAIAQAGGEAARYRTQLIEGANQELHELTVKGSMYGLDLNAERIRHRGTNAGTADIKGWWQDALAAYRAGDKDKAYFLTGVMLHFIQDMGVPAHANNVYHQGNAREFDNFEMMGLSNWKPDFSTVNRRDPGYSDPSQYYALSASWTRADAPGYRDRDAFSKTWLTADDDERKLLSARQARTAAVCAWALRSALRAFQGAGR